MKILFYADTVFGYGGVQRVLSVVAKSLAAENGKSVGLSNKVDILTIDNDSHVDIYGYKQTPITFKYISFHTPHVLLYFSLQGREHGIQEMVATQQPHLMPLCPQFLYAQIQAHAHRRHQ